QDETDNDVEDNGSNKDEKQQDDQNKHDETTGTNDEIADYEEAEVIEDHIDIADMDVKVETDNPNKRVLLFSNNDKLKYKTNKNNDKRAKYEEVEVIEEHIDIADMDVKVETDNPNKRVLLFSDNDKVMYKTIYIKEKQRLKIIDIYEDNGQIFNEII